ncbi:SEP-domain-containing protein [Pleomassaria siparia CBS 279.74]|uniref:SEP-domain-containing protein n=1 Tax=Pleomassaria siparia CBS 279.74 TaxID=1314801 RepID=A0A6G1JYV2_9PLEO|nr:SEP-domain-containing protein [Pleomassaria siparia CBS 279.74]
MAGPPPNVDALVAELSGLTGLPPTEAEQYLQAGNWDLQASASLFFDQEQGEADEEEEADVDMADHEAQQPTSTPQHQPGGGRTLDGTYVPPVASSSSSAQPSSSSRQPPKRGVAGLRTLKDLQSQGGGGHGHAHDDDDGSDDDKDENQDFFAGGEKSGLAVQNPNQAANPRDHINNIIRRARQNAPRPGGDDEQPATRFSGTGMTLGGDDAPSRTIPDPRAAATPTAPPRAHRELHLWRDGFSVDDGPLFRYDDPANADTLEMINNGHAPLNILNVERGQEVDVEVHAHKDQDYVQPKKKWVPFGGSGQRLGSPTPGATSTPVLAPATRSNTSAASTSTAPAAQASVDIDGSIPTITLQIRLGDGTRLTSRFNTTHTVGDVYGFVGAASPASGQREYALMTTFPSKELSDKSQVLGDMAEFKRGGVVVQKWK